MYFLKEKDQKPTMEKRLEFQILQSPEALWCFSVNFQLASDEAIGVGGKYGMKEEGQELEGMREERRAVKWGRGGGGEQGSCCLPLYLLSEVQGG